MGISIENLKMLRAQTNAAMMDCQKALKESDGDLQKAKAWLRERGIALAEKKADRVAQEGVVCAAVLEDKTAGFLFEINSETDFVSRNNYFQEFVSRVREIALEKEICDKEALMDLPYNEEGSIDEQIKILSGRIGEKIEFSRFKALSIAKGEGIISHYIHRMVGPDMGRIGVLISLKSQAPMESLESICHDLCLHVAAFPFVCLEEKEIDENLLEKYFGEEKERCVGLNQTFCAQTAKKSYCKENVILEQGFVKDSRLMVKTYLEEKGAALGYPISIAQVVRFECGKK